jgi:hypothetical protein
LTGGFHVGTDARDEDAVDGASVEFCVGDHYSGQYAGCRRDVEHAERVDEGISAKNFVYPFTAIVDNARPAAVEEEIHMVEASLKCT